MPQPTNSKQNGFHGWSPFPAMVKKKYIGIACDFDRALIEKDFVELVEPILTSCKIGSMDESHFRPW